MILQLMTVQSKLPRGATICSAVFCLLLLGPGCGKEAPEAVEMVRPVKLMTVGGTGAVGKLEYPGSVSAAQRSEMAFEVPGKIVKLPVLEGEDVEEGQILAQLDARDYEARLASAQAQVNKAKADYNRGQSIREEDPGAIAQITIDTYRQALEVARASYQEAEKAVEDTILRAPFAGKVARKLVDDFANAQAKEAVLILEDDSHLEIQISIPEQDAVRGRRGATTEEVTELLKPTVEVSAIPNRSFPARIKEFSTTADPVTRTFQGTLAFDKPTGVQVLPGMTAKVVIDRSRVETAREGTLIPASATRTDETGAAFVWVVNASTMKVSRTEVKLGHLSGSQVEVLSGLENGDQIATSGVHHLRDGMKVRRFGE